MTRQKAGVPEVEKAFPAWSCSRQQQRSEQSALEQKQCPRMDQSHWAAPAGTSEQIRGQAGFGKITEGGKKKGIKLSPAFTFRFSEATEQPSEADTEFFPFVLL